MPSKITNKCTCDIDDWYCEQDPDGIRRIICNKCGKDLLKALIQAEKIRELEGLENSELANRSLKKMQIRISGRIKALNENK